MRRPGAAFLAAFVLMLVATAATTGIAIAPFGPPAAFAQRAVDQPPNARGMASPSDDWRAVKGGLQGDVSLPNKAAGVLIQPGESFREWRNGPLYRYGLWTLGGMLLLLAAFYVIRGRIRLDSGWSGRLIERFTGIERFTHWLTATSFIILGLSGLNMLYGRYLLLPLIGPPGFAWLTHIGKLSHDYVSFAFMLGMEGAFSAMGNGKVDASWAQEHHSLWLAETETHKPATADD